MIPPIIIIVCLVAILVVFIPPTMTNILTSLCVDGSFVTREAVPPASLHRVIVVRPTTIIPRRWRRTRIVAPDPSHVPHALVRRSVHVIQQIQRRYHSIDTVPPESLEYARRDECYSDRRILRTT